MAASIPIGGVVRFTNPNDGRPDVGQLQGWAGGDLVVMTRDGIVYVDTRSVMAGGRRRNRKNRKGSRKANRKGSRKANRKGSRKANRSRKNRKSRKNRN
jgi:hypothetical protein